MVKNSSVKQCCYKQSGCRGGNDCELNCKMYYPIEQLQQDVGKTKKKEHPSKFELIGVR